MDLRRYDCTPPNVFGEIFFDGKFYVILIPKEEFYNKALPDRVRISEETVLAVKNWEKTMLGSTQAIDVTVATDGFDRAVESKIDPREIYFAHLENELPTLYQDLGKLTILSEHGEGHKAYWEVKIKLLNPFQPSAEKDALEFYTKNGQCANRNYGNVYVVIYGKDSITVRLPKTLRRDLESQKSDPTTHEDDSFRKFHRNLAEIISHGYKTNTNPPGFVDL